MYDNQEQQQTGAPGPGYEESQRRATAERKSPLAAVVLSALPGLGQVYVGYYQRGFINIAVVAGTIFLLNQRDFSEFTPLLGVFLAFFWVYNMIDAARCATAVNRGAEAGMRPELPELPAAVGGGGNTFAGVILVLLGLVFLGRTVLGISLEWLADWWPMFLVLIGLRMILGGRSGRHRRRRSELE